MQPISEQFQTPPFQTPPFVARYMISLIPEGVKTVLEPTPGQGNIVKELNGKYNVIAPEDFFLWQPVQVDCVVMNSPFTDKEVDFTNAPREVKKLKGANIGYWFIEQMNQYSDNVIALVPWYTIINSKKRTWRYMQHGLASIINLSRSVFRTRIQVCILQFRKGYEGKTEFRQL